MRILFYASYPDQPIGYSKVAHAIASWLATAASAVEVYYFGIGNDPAKRCTERTLGANEGIHMIDVEAMPNADEFGMNILADTLASLKPDIFLIYNDLIVTCRAFNALLQYRATHPQTRFISYIDLVYPFEKMALIQHMDRNTDEMLVFSECWRRNLLDMGVSARKVRVFPHGFSAHLFWPQPMQAAKAYFGFAPDDFVILNANRNTYRKAQDVAIRAFVQFLIREQWNPRIKMFLHCSQSTTSGYNLGDVLEIEACRAKVSVTALQERIRMIPRAILQDAEMNLLYNAADIGLNTCIGEGFGLCNMEHAAIGKPQIVSRVGGLADIFADGGAILVEPRTWIRAATCLDEHSGDLGMCDATDFAAAMSRYFHDDAKREGDGMWGIQVLPRRYEWSRLLSSALGPILATATPSLPPS